MSYLAKADEIPTGYIYPWKSGEVVLILGEIDGMEGHAVIVLKDGRTVFGYHTDNFTRLTEDEL